MSLYSIFLITAIAVLIYYAAKMMYQSWEHELDIANFYKKNHLIHTDIKNIKKSFKDNPELYKKAAQEYDDEKKALYIYNENKRKKAIAKRVYAYEYEDMLYQIFAPIVERYCYTDLYWSTYRINLSKEYLVQKITEIIGITEEGAEQIIEYLASKDILFNYDGRYHLTSMLEKGTGDTYERWNIISDTDMNIDKWMNEHGYKHKNN